LPIAEAIKCLSQRRQDEIAAYLAGDLSPSAMRAIVTAIVRELDNWVGEELPAARAAFPLMLQEREKALLAIMESHSKPDHPGQNYHSKIVTRVSDLFYLLLSRHGSLDLPDNCEGADKLGGPFLRRFFKTATDAVIIALYATA